MGQGVRVVALWMVPITIFATLYFMFDASPQSRPVARIVVYLFLLFAVFCAAMFVFFTREARRFHADNNAAKGLVARGELEKARGMFQAWTERAHGSVPAALSRHNLGWTLLRLGKLRDAVGVFADVELNEVPGLRATGLYATTALDLALGHALLGELASAEEWMAKAVARETAGQLPSFQSGKAFVRAVIDCRAGRTEEAARALDDRWAELEAVLTGEILRPLRVVRAFAHAGAGPRGAGIPEMQLANTRPAYPGEYDFLGVDWPEMATFLAAQRLSGG